MTQKLGEIDPTPEIALVPRWRARGVAAVTAGAGLAAVVLTGCGNSTQPSTCLSPRASSSVYPGDSGADPLNRATWSSGVEIDTVVPSGASGVIVGYRGANADWSADRDSKPVSPDIASVIGVKIGHDAVAFSIRIQAAAGSSACANMPEVQFGQPQPMDTVLQKGAILPDWTS